MHFSDEKELVSKWSPKSQHGKKINTEKPAGCRLATDCCLLATDSWLLAGRLLASGYWLPTAGSCLKAVLRPSWQGCLKDCGDSADFARIAQQVLRNKSFGVVLGCHCPQLLALVLLSLSKGLAHGGLDYAFGGRHTSRSMQLGRQQQKTHHAIAKARQLTCVEGPLEANTGCWLLAADR